MRSRRAVGSLIGIGFLLMILALGFSYYNIGNRVEENTQNIIEEMMAIDRAAAARAVKLHELWSYSRLKIVGTVSEKRII